MMPQHLICHIYFFVLLSPVVLQVFLAAARKEKGRHQKPKLNISTIKE
jgi:multisubunit Na+/H+ antiporter MnhG subunit